MAKSTGGVGVEVDQAELARILGVARSTMVEWRHAGCPHRVEGNKVWFNTADVDRWRNRRNPGPLASTEETQQTAPGRMSESEAKRRKEVALAQTRELELDQKRGKLIDRDALAAKMALIGQSWREALQRVARQMAPEVHAAQNRHEAIQIAQVFANQLLADATTDIESIIRGSYAAGGSDEADTSDEVVGVGGQVPEA